MTKPTASLAERMRKAAENCMNSWETGKCIPAEKAEYWADELDEIVAAHLQPETEPSEGLRAWVNNALVECDSLPIEEVAVMLAWKIFKRMEQERQRIADLLAGAQEGSK